MRKMFSKNQIEEMSRASTEALIEEGALDENIADAVDNYLEENPIGPASIAGLDIAPKDVAASGNITGASIIENMSGYSMDIGTGTLAGLMSFDYAGVVKNGNKITFAIAGKLTTTDSDLNGTTQVVATFNIPSSIGSKLYPINGEHLAYQRMILSKSYLDFKTCSVIPAKFANTNIGVYVSITEALSLATTYHFRFEITFLLSDNLAE